MAEVSLFFAALLQTSDGDVEAIGDVRTPVVLTGLDGDISDVEQKVADAAKATLYDVDELSLGAVAWQFLWLESDKAVEVELTTDKDGSAGAKQLYTVKLAANVPFILASRVSYSNYTENFGGGTLDTIDRIRVNNTSGAEARVRLLLAR